MRKEFDYFLLALGFFTRVPVPSVDNFKESDLNHSAKYFPLIGNTQVWQALLCGVM